MTPSSDEFILFDALPFEVKDESRQRIVINNIDFDLNAQKIGRDINDPNIGGIGY